MSQPRAIGARARHVGGFLVSGLLAYLTDVAVTKLLGVAAGLPWAAARLGGIAVAMVVAWLCHRRLTFALAGPPSLREFMRYAAMGWTAAALNYAVFVGLVWARPEWDAAVAIAAASLVAMIFSYLAMRFKVFR